MNILILNLNKWAYQNNIQLLDDTSQMDYLILKRQEYI